MTYDHGEITKEITAILADRYLFAVAEDSAVHARTASVVYERITKHIAQNIYERMICCPASWLPGNPEPEQHQECFYAAKAIRIIEEGPEHV